MALITPSTLPSSASRLVSPHAVQDAVKSARVKRVARERRAARAAAAEASAGVGGGCECKVLCALENGSGLWCRGETVPAARESLTSLSTTPAVRHALCDTASPEVWLSCAAVTSAGGASDGTVLVKVTTPVREEHKQRGFHVHPSALRPAFNKVEDQDVGPGAEVRHRRAVRPSHPRAPLLF